MIDWKGPVWPTSTFPPALYKDKARTSALGRSRKRLDKHGWALKHVTIFFKSLEIAGLSCRQISGMWVVYVSTRWSIVLVKMDNCHNQALSINMMKPLHTPSECPPGNSHSTCCFRTFRKGQSSSRTFHL